MKMLDVAQAAAATSEGTHAAAAAAGAAAASIAAVTEKVMVLALFLVSRLVAWRLGFRV